MLRWRPLEGLNNSTSLHRERRQQIQEASAFKCLGVHLSSDATFHHHIEETVKKTNQIAGWIVWTFKTREKECLLTLWKALVQPVLDYSCQLWSPHKAADIQALE